MKKKLFLILISFIMLLLVGCKTSNEIHNTSYDVNVSINDINEAFVPASLKAKEAVVGVSLYTKAGITRSWYIQATGSGVIYKGMAYLKNGSTKGISETKDSDDVKYYEYYVLTNAHVVNSNAAYKDIKVYLSKIDTLVSSELVGYNAYEDLAVVKFTTSIYIKPLEFGSENPKVGEIVLACGNPLGYDYTSTVTMGIISNEERYLNVERDTDGDGVDDWEGTSLVIQHDAAINSGNSGGALVNIKGELVGINAMKVTDSKETIEGIGFAIPISVVLSVLEKMENGEKASPNLLKNSTIYDVNELLNKEVLRLNKLPDVDLSNLAVTYGAYVYNSSKNEYGLKSGDVIVGMNDNVILNEGMLEANLRTFNGSSITWKLYRNNELTEIIYNFE